MAEETKNLCAQIPASLHAQVREQQEISGKTLGQYMTWLLTEFYAYEKGGNGRMADNKRTVAFQVPAELFDQLKAYLTRHNAGLLAHAEVMDMIQDTKGKLPVISLIGSKVGCFGGMGFVAAATDAIIMSPLGRLGLTGPEVIEQEMGKEEFDASDKSLVSRTTGGKHKYIMQDCNILVEDTVMDFRRALCDLLAQPYEKVCACRRIGSYELVKEQMDLVALAAELNPGDAKDVWRYYGNEHPELLPELETAEFLRVVHRRPKEVR